ncbi:MAG: sulfite exporter TauE/SafE family protein [Syntrophomonadaceae bacterium]|nr:sulfite exporter TauE/SafE family protein [Syntrophomonadaceae bacterium]
MSGINEIEIVNRDPHLKAGGKGRTAGKWLAGVLIILGLGWIVTGIFDFDLWQMLKDLYRLKYFTQLGHEASYGVLFVLGLLTSFHCVGMCGGITISQTIRSANYDIKRSLGWLVPSAQYNAGRVMAYTLVGGMVGGIGQVISFPGIWKGIIPLVGGIFMIVMGLNLLDIFPFLRRLTLPVPHFVAKKILNPNHHYSPFYVGLLTGLMPCGPLQIVQLYALGTRSVVFGALSMFIFSLGTVPLLFSFGAVNSFINKKNINYILKASALFVIVLGLAMAGRGLSLSGIMPNMAAMMPAPINSTPADAAIARIDGNNQTVTITIRQDSFVPIVVQKGIPVRWIIQADAGVLNECNKAISVPKYKIDKNLTAGENIVEFTPRETGEFVYTCWMGMIRSKITVVDDLSQNQAAVNNSPVDPIIPATSSHHMSQGPTEAAEPGPDQSSAMRPGEEERSQSVGTQPSASSPTVSTTTNKTIIIEGMMCDNCVKHVQEALLSIDGVQAAEVVIGRASVTLNKEVGNDTLKARIEQGGNYTVKSIGAGQ